MYFCFLCLTLSFTLVLPLSWKRTDLVEARHFVTNKTAWYPSSDVTYSLDPKLISNERVHIQRQLQNIEAVSCIKTIEVDHRDCHHYDQCIRFLKDEEPKACRADRRLLQIRLTKHCYDQYQVLQAIFHILGFEHEHQRPDRDCYVRVHPSVVNNAHYKKMSNLDTSFPYDSQSVTHYRRTPYLRPAEKVWSQNIEFGSLDALSQLDVVALNYMYCAGPHYCEINPVRCEFFNCWVTCNECSDEQRDICSSCKTYLN